MAEEKPKSGSWYGTAGKFVHGAVTLALGVTSFYLGTKDTSPKSLASIASTLESIAGHLEAGDTFNASELDTVGEIVKYTSAIEGTVVEKAAGNPLPGVDAVLVVGGDLPLKLGETRSMTLASGDRVSVTFAKTQGSSLVFVVNGRQFGANVGYRLFKSTNGACFVEFLGVNEARDEVSIRPFCN